MYKRNITGSEKFHRMGRRTGSANLPIPTSMYSELSKSTAINYDNRHRQKSPSSIGKHGNFLAVNFVFTSLLYQKHVAVHGQFRNAPKFFPSPKAGRCDYEWDDWQIQDLPLT